MTATRAPARSTAIRLAAGTGSGAADRSRAAHRSEADARLAAAGRSSTARGQHPAGSRIEPLAPPASAPIPRPPLRLVSPDPEARSRGRRRAITAVLAGLVLVGLFAIVGVRVLLAQGQARVDELEARMAAAEAEHSRLRLEVASLESPGRIVSEARDRLGMVPPATVTHLEPLPAG